MRWANPVTAGTARTRRPSSGSCSTWSRNTPGTSATWTSSPSSPPAAQENKADHPERTGWRPRSVPASPVRLDRLQLVPAGVALDLGRVAALQQLDQPGVLAGRLGGAVGQVGEHGRADPVQPVMG